MNKKIVLSVFFATLTGCSTHQPLNGTAIDEMTVEVHEAIHGDEAIRGSDSKRVSSIATALMPKVKPVFPHPYAAHRRFDIAVKDVPARLFYMELVSGSPNSIVVSPEIEGNITLNLKQSTVEQALKAVEDTYGFVYHRIPGGYEIIPNKLETKIYTVNYLELDRTGQSKMHMTSGEVTEVMNSGGGGAGGGGGGIAPSSPSAATSVGASLQGSTTVNAGIGTVETKNHVDFWKQLQISLDNLLGGEKKGGRSVTINPMAGILVVHAYPKEHKQIETYLNLLQRNSDRQVLLEAKVLEVSLSNTYQMGIDWDIFGAQLNAINSFPGTNISLSEFPDAFVINIDWMQGFSTTIQALETQGNVQVLSSPRVTAMNNQKSLIKVGNDAFYVTDLTPNTVVAAVPTTTGSNSFTPSFTPFFSGITLDVTPQIDKHGDVTLHIHPSVSQVTEDTKRLALGSGVSGIVELPFAQSTIRESDTIVHAKNGQVVILGGLIQNQTSDSVAQLPFFGNIPFLGTLLRNTYQISNKTELVILLKATLISNRKTVGLLKDEAQRIAASKRGMHFGSRPDIFGTEGEEPITLGPKAATYTQPGSRVGE